MDRRSTIKLLTGAGALAVAGGGGHWLTRERQHPALAMHVDDHLGVAGAG